MFPQFVMIPIETYDMNLSDVMARKLRHTTFWT